MRCVRSPLAMPLGNSVWSYVFFSKEVRDKGKSQLRCCSASSIYYRNIWRTKTIQTQNEHFLIVLNKTVLAGNKAHAFVMLKMTFFSSNTLLSCAFRCSLYRIAGIMLAQASIIRFRRACFGCMWEWLHTLVV